MKIEIHIDNSEVDDIIETLKDQGIDISRAEVESHIEDYIQGAIHDFRHERMDCVVDSIIDLQDWFLYTVRMKIEKLIQHLQNLDKNDKDIVITDPNGYQYKIESLNYDEDSDTVYLGLDEGSCD